MSLLGKLSSLCDTNSPYDLGLIAIEEDIVRHWDHAQTFQ